MDPKLLLLGLLRRQEMHGYLLFEYIGRVLSTCTDLKKPGAYYLLGRMARDGWIEEHLEQAGNRPPRKVYRLTPIGEAVFQQQARAALAGYSPPESSFDAGLAFADALPPDEAYSLLQQRRTAIAAALESVQAAPMHPGSLGRLIERQVKLLNADLDWTDAYLEHLSN